MTGATYKCICGAQPPESDLSKICALLFTLLTLSGAVCFTATTICFKSFGQTGFASGNIRTVLKPSGKLAMIWKNPDRFGSIGRVEQVFSVVRAKTFRTRKNFPGSNATLLPRFLGLWGRGRPFGASAGF